MKQELPKMVNHLLSVGHAMRKFRTNMNDIERVIYA